MKNSKTLRLTQLSLLVAIQLILTLTPLGYIMVPPISATVMHIPVIVGAILLGPGSGALLGGVFGLTAMWKASTAATAVTDMAFSPFLSGKPVQSIVMCVFTRILLGLIAAWLYRAFLRLFNGRVTPAILAGSVLATLCHTVMVLGCLALFFREFGMGLMAVVLTACSITGLVEMGLAALVSAAICRPLLAYLHRAG